MSFLESQITKQYQIPLNIRNTIPFSFALLATGSRSFLIKFAGVSIFLVIWHFLGISIATNPDLVSFADFAPGPTFTAFIQMVANGELLQNALPSLSRIAYGICYAFILGIPVGLLVGLYKILNDSTYLSFQFLRMISPLAWMPLAVMVFATWDSAIIFLITMAAVWPLILSSSASVKRIEPNWFAVARNLGASEFQIFCKVVIPAVLYDIFNGLRLSIGIAWVVIVPAEYLGVSSGLGYAINDARDTLEYDRLSAYVISIGLIGFILDNICTSITKKVNWVGRENT